MSYIGPTALDAMWTKIVALLAGKADRNSVYSKAETQYLMATHDWSGSQAMTSGSSSSSGTYVTLTTDETISGNKTFSGSANTFYSSGLRVRSTSTSYYATIANAATANTTVYLPTNSGNNYLLGRSAAATTANTVPYYSNTTGGMGTKTLATSTLTESTNEVPTSAAIIAYLRAQGLIS